MTLRYMALAALMLLAGATHSLAQTNARDRLENLRSELDSLSAVLKQYQASERDLGSRIKALDQQIAKRKSLIRELQSQRRSEQRAIARYNDRIERSSDKLGSVRSELADTREEVRTLETQVAQRAVYLYKRGHRQALGFLVAAEDPGDYVRRRLYVQRIHDRDRRNLEALRSARRRQESSEQELERTLADLRTAREKRRAAIERMDRLMAETRSERSALEADKSSLDRTLAGLRDDKEAVKKLIADREAAARQVEQWIASLESRRQAGSVQEITVGPRSMDAVVRDIPTFRSFASARGRLPWPVKGQVIRRFGLEKNRITGTVTDNPGIDIRAREGDEVLAVQGGVCTRITYLRGFGTTVLVQHEEGYYTVYAHLGDVWVSEGETVEAGRVIGTVGSSGGASTPRLHFQVWHQRSKENPMTWLAS